jgi:hypothetical protein
MPDQLQIQVVVDASQGTTGFNQLGSAASQMADKLRASGLGANELSSALKNLGFSSEETAAALGPVAVAGERAASGLSATGGGAAKARVELAALSGSAMAAEMGLARLAGQSALLAPIISAAFPLFGAIALGEILGILVGKVSDWMNASSKIKQEWQDIDNSLAQDSETIKKSITSLEAKTIELTKGPLAELDFELKQITDTAGNLDSVVEKTFTKITEVLKDQNLSFIDPLRWIGQGTGDLQNKLKAALPDIQETLNTKGAVAGLARMDDLLDELRKKRADMEEETRKALTSGNPSTAGFKIDDSQMQALNQTLQRLEALRDVMAGQAEKPIFEAAEKNAEIVAEKRKLAAEADKRGYEDDHAMEEQARKDKEDSLALIREQVSAQAELLRQKSDAVTQSADASKPGSSDRINAEKAFIVELQAEQANAQAAMLAEKTAGNAQLYSVEAEYYKQVTSLLDEYKAKVITETREAATQAAEAAKKAAEEEQRVDDQTMRAKIENANKTAQTKDIGVEGEERAKLISPGEAAAEFTQIANAQLAAEQSAIQKRLSELDAADPQFLQKQAELNRQLETAEQEHARRVAQIDSQLLQSRVKQWDQMFAPANNMLEQITRTVLSSSLTWEQAFRRAGDSFVLSTITSLEKVVLKHAESWLLMEALQHSSLARQLADLIAGGASKKAIQSTENELSVQSSAGAGAAAAFASVMESVPFPANIAIAPATAASTLGQIEAFGSLASAAGGMMVAEDGQLAMLHKQEMVLPATISGGLQKMISGGTGSGGSASGGDTHIHFSPNISAIDGKSIKKMFADQQGQMMTALKQAVRSGQLRPR